MTTLEHSPQLDLLPTESASMSSVAGSPAKTSASPGKAQALQESAADCGETMPVWLANYDRATSSWKTSQHCLLAGLATYSETWPRSGMTRNGTAYLLPPLVRLTDGIASGSLPTPTADAAITASPSPAMAARFRRKGRSGSFVEAMSNVMWPTPRASEWKGTCPLGSKSHKHRVSRGYLDATAQEVTGQTGRLNPQFVEWMMGFPVGWTDLSPLETQ